MLDRESACNRVFLARRCWASVRPRSFSSWPLPRGSTISSPLPYCRTNQTSSDVGMIGMITANARRRRTRTGNAMEPSKNSSMISRARGHAGHASARARQGAIRTASRIPIATWRLMWDFDELSYFNRETAYFADEARALHCETNRLRSHYVNISFAWLPEPARRRRASRAGRTKSPDPPGSACQLSAAVAVIKEKRFTGLNTGICNSGSTELDVRLTRNIDVRSIRRPGRDTALRGRQRR